MRPKTRTVESEAADIRRLLRGGLQPEDSDYFARACRTDRRRAAAMGAIAMQPARRACGFELRRGQVHYVLRNNSSELARFKVGPTGRLTWVEEAR